jgi:hypothetical protein
MSLFTAQQKKDCALILASLVRAVNIHSCNSLGGSFPFASVICSLHQLTFCNYVSHSFDVGISCRR